MARQICLILEAHVPVRPEAYRVFSVGRHHQYFNGPRNEEAIRTAAKKSFYPTNDLLIDLAEELGGRMKLGIILSGSTMELARAHEPRLLGSFRRLARCCGVEFLAETSWRAQPGVCSREGRRRQLKRQHDLIMSSFGTAPRVYFDYCNLLNDEIAHDVNELGYEGVFTAKHRGASSSYLFSLSSAAELFGFEPHHELARNITLRFSDRSWDAFPLTAERFVQWIMSCKEDTVVLHLPYTVFGMTHTEQDGIFDFLEWTLRLCNQKGIRMVTPAEHVSMQRKHEQERIAVDAPQAPLHDHAPEELLEKRIREKVMQLEGPIQKTKDDALIADWERLTSIEQYRALYVHRKKGVLRPHPSQKEPYDLGPYDLYMTLCNVLDDLQARLRKKAAMMPGYPSDAHPETVPHAS